MAAAHAVLALAAIFFIAKTGWRCTSWQRRRIGATWLPHRIRAFHRRAVWLWILWRGSQSIAEKSSREGTTRPAFCFENAIVGHVL